MTTHCCGPFRHYHDPTTHCCGPLKVCSGLAHRLKGSPSFNILIGSAIRNYRVGDTNSKISVFCTVFLQFPHSYAENCNILAVICNNKEPYRCYYWDLDADELICIFRKECF